MFSQELHVFGGVPARKKYETIDLVRDSLYIQVSPGHFCCMRRPSLVELVGQKVTGLLI